MNAEKLLTCIGAIQHALAICCMWGFMPFSFLLLLFVSKNSINYTAFGKDVKRR